MTTLLIVNAVLCAIVATVVLGMIGWAIRGSTPRNPARLSGARGRRATATAIRGRGRKQRWWALS